MGGQIMLRNVRLAMSAFALLQSAAMFAQDAKQIVQQAVQTELNADRNDHSRWMYLDYDSRPGHTVKQWVAQTPEGDVQRVIEMNGQPLSRSEQRARIENFLRDSSARSKQRKGEQHDDQQAAEMLRLLPQAFLWTNEGPRGNVTVLHFKPDPRFRPPDFEAKVFAAMEGEMDVDTREHRIVSLKGRLIRDVKIAGGLFGSLNSGGTFDVERRRTGGGIWQITETHVHIEGHALIFKSISEQEDEVKSEFKQLTQDISMQQAETDLLAQVK
jgi:hypothetical protein